MTYIKDKECLLKEKYNGQQTSDFFSDVERLKDGEPLDYIIGNSDFLHCNIALKGRPLIPRVETEYWVNRAIEEINQEAQNKPISILDIFSGSGCIGAALLKHIENISLTSTESRKNLLSTIELNLKQNSSQNSNYTVLQSDVFENVTGVFDYIFANPPYIDKEKDITDKSVLENEPHDALFAKENGLFYIKKLILESPNFLKPGGALFIEFDSWQKELLNEYVIAQTSLYESYEFWNDQHNLPRVIKLTTPK